MTLLLAGGLLLALGALLHTSLRKRALENQIRSLHRELQHMQESCGRLAPPSVVQQLVGGDTAQTAERKVATVMFVDLVGYTELSERTEATVLAELLNGYFERVHNAVTAHRGRIATYLGDGVLAYFGAFEPNPWQCDDAVAAALDLVLDMQRYADELAARGLPRLRVGIGIHRGSGLAGLVGTEERMEYAFVGRTVNTAARAQTLTRVHGCAVLITATVREALGPHVQLRALPPTAVKGIKEPLETYEVVARSASVAEPTRATSG
jgi:class 3 adenylate cyclase